MFPLSICAYSDKDYFRLTGLVPATGEIVEAYSQEDGESFTIR